jgi:hypothetical protein
MVVRRSHSSKLLNRYGKFRYMEEALQVRNIQVRTTVSFTNENVLIVHD